MNKNMLLTYFVLSSCVSQAQSYIPVPDTNAAWNVHEQFYMPCGPFDYQWGNHDMTLSITGDTVFNGFTYRKLSASLHDYTTEIIGIFCNENLSSYYYNVPYGAFRNDTAAKQVWFIRYGFCNVPGVMYDFSLNAGDSLTSVNGCGVTPVGVVLADTTFIYGGVPRKVLLYKYLINFTSFETSTIIEGIGSVSAGLFDAYHHFEYNSSLICFKVNDTTIYPNDTTTCDIISAVREWAKTKTSFNVFPNPGSAYFNLSFPFPVSGYLEMYNSMGEKVFTENIMHASSHKLYLQDFIPGVYFIRMNDGKNNFTKSVIVQKD